MSVRVPLAGRNEIVLGSDGWLSPAGLFFSCLSTEHDELAAAIVAQRELIRDAVYAKFEYEWQLAPWNELPDREKLYQIGFVLIRGPVHFSEVESNYTLTQLKMMSEAKIILRSAFDDSIAITPKKIVDFSSFIIDGIKSNSIVTKIKADFDKGSVYGPWFNGFLRRTFAQLCRFYTNPFQTVVQINECWDSNKPKDHKIFPGAIFNELSRGFTDEMFLGYDRNSIVYRIAELKGFKLLSVWNEYSHDGINGGIDGDFNNHLYLKVVDDRSLESELRNLLQWRDTYWKEIPVRISYSNKGDYFKEVVNKIICS